MIEATDILKRTQFYVLKHYKSIHFHCHGEHLINGDQPDLSMHMVFHREGPNTHEDNYAVIEIMFMKVAEEFSDKLSGDVLLKKMGIQQHPVTYNIIRNLHYIHILSQKKATFNFADLLQDVINKPDFYHYKGSLTTPPCSEVVSWFVYKYPLEISSASIAFMEDAWVNDPEFSNGRGNYRFPQYLNGRKVFEVTADIEYEFEEPKAIKLMGQRLFFNFVLLMGILAFF